MPSVERAVILAAGLGTRLKWFTDRRPKALMEVGGESAVVRVIRRLAAQGIDEVAVNVHHHADALMEALGDGARFGVRLCFSRESRLLDSGGGVKRALALLPDGGPVAVHNADVVADVDLRALAARLPAGGAAVALVPNPAHHPRGDFALDRDGLVRLDDAGAPRHTYAGVALFDPMAFDAEPAGEAFPLTRTFARLAGGRRLAGMLHRGMWFDIGRPRDLVRAQRALAARP